MMGAVHGGLHRTEAELVGMVHGARDDRNDPLWIVEWWKEVVVGTRRGRRDNPLSFSFTELFRLKDRRDNQVHKYNVLRQSHRRLLNRNTHRR